MSTRCQIVFKKFNEYQDEVESVLAYKHSDGYPSSTVPELREFHHWMPRKKDLEYYTATWFYYQKRKYEKQFAPDDFEKDEADHNSWLALGYGICPTDHVHGDVYHFYVVDLDEEQIYLYEINGADYNSPDEIVDQNMPDREFDLTVDPSQEVEN